MKTYFYIEKTLYFRNGERTPEPVTYREYNETGDMSPVDAVKGYIEALKAVGTFDIPDIATFDVIKKNEKDDVLEVYRVGKLYDNITVQHDSELEVTL